MKVKAKIAILGLKTMIAIGSVIILGIVGGIELDIISMSQVINWGIHGVAFIIIGLGLLKLGGYEFNE